MLSYASLCFPYAFPMSILWFSCVCRLLFQCSSLLFLYLSYAFPDLSYVFLLLFICFSHVFSSFCIAFLLCFQCLSCVVPLVFQYVLMFVLCFWACAFLTCSFCVSCVFRMLFNYFPYVVLVLFLCFPCVLFQ